MGSDPVVNSFGPGEYPRRDRIEDLRHLARRILEVDRQVWMSGADRVEHPRQVLLEVPALRHEERKDGDRRGPFARERGDRFLQRRAHLLEECERDGIFRAARLHALVDVAKGLGPFRIARAVREEHDAAHQCLPVDPKPPAPRALSSNASTMLSSTCAIGTMTICAMRSIGFTTKGSRLRFQHETKTCPW